MRNAFLLAAGLAIALAACAPVAPAPNTPQAADRPIGGADNFRVAADPRVLAGRGATTTPVPGGALSLPQMIDIAQRNNPSTRAAWLRAREAAEAVGLVETTYLPRLNANIVAGVTRTGGAGYQDSAGLLPEGTVAVGGGALSAQLSAQWLLFDFGKREAARGEARELAFAANVGFSAAHQRLIYQVTQAYHDLHAATRREAVNRRRLANAQALSRAARAKLAQGIATITDTARANQAVAQARFDLARSHSATRTAHTRLAAELGLPAGRSVTPAFPAQISLPRDVPRNLDRHIEQALMRRPDLQAAFARARASEQHIAAVASEFRPRIAAAATLGASFGSASVDDDRIPGSFESDRSRPVASAFVGVTIPLWDAGARERRLRIAMDRHAGANAEAESLRLLAESEIVGAYELLKSSLAANAAARELIATSRTSYNAARKFYDEGLATVAEVSLARQLLFDAEISQIEAQHAAFSAAATLAFASGQLG